MFFEQLNAGCAELRADAAAWAEHEAERALWDVTLLDGLDRDESWTEDGRPKTLPLYRAPTHERIRHLPTRNDNDGRAFGW
jgi:hypothetical protein